MARPAAEPAGLLRGLVGDLLARTPGRLEMALRIALICAATTLVGEVYQVPGLDLAVYVVFFVTKPDRVGTVVTSVVLTILLSLLLVLILGLTRLVLDQPFWLMVCMAATSILLLFIASASKLGPLAGTIALVVGYGLDVMGQMPIGEFATRAILYAWLLVGLPAPMSMLISMAIAPSPRALVQRDLAERLGLAGALWRGEEVGAEAREALREGAGEMLKRLKMAGLERTSAASDLTALRQAVLDTVAILALADLIHRTPSARPPDAIAEALAETLDRMAAILARGRYPLEIEPPWDTTDGLDPEAAAVLRRMETLLRGFAIQVTAPAAAKEKSGFFRADAFSNPDHTAYALKATAAAMLCYVIYSLLDWSGIHTAFITCYIVSLGTTAETVEKLGLRLTGAILGAAVGMGTVVWAVPALDTIQQLLVLVMLGSAVGGWIAAGSERVGYIGYQFAFAFFICVLHGYGPSADLVGARDRVIGVLLGNLVSYMILTTIRPISIANRVDPAIAGVLRQLPSAAGSAPALASVQEALGGLERDLRLALLEPARLRARDAWIASRRRAVERIGGIAAMLLADDKAGADASDWLRRLAGSMDRQGAGPTDAEPSFTSPFGSSIEAELLLLEADLRLSLSSPRRLVPAVAV